MSKYVPPSIRLEVATRAHFTCEYCRLPEMVGMVKFQVEHVISIQHGGKTKLSNLAYSCPVCNWNKGPNIGTILHEGGPLIPFFHPRVHIWDEHFDLHAGQILPKTLIGEATIKILKFNELDQLLERRELMESGLYP